MIKRRNYMGKQISIITQLKINMGNESNAQVQIKRGMEFFKDKFSSEPLNEDIVTENNIKELKLDTKPISKQEIRKAIINMKNGKAPGPDNIRT
jgi:hypothetical protein